MLYVFLAVITFLVLFMLWCMLRMAKIADDRTYKSNDNL